MSVEDVLGILRQLEQLPPAPASVDAIFRLPSGSGKVTIEELRRARVALREHAALRKLAEGERE